jgi:hypothetical protein
MNKGQEASAMVTLDLLSSSSPMSYTTKHGPCGVANEVIPGRHRVVQLPPRLPLQLLRLFWVVWFFGLVGFGWLVGWLVDWFGLFGLRASVRG